MKFESTYNHQWDVRGKLSGTEQVSHLMTLFSDVLRDIYGAEKALKKALPKMIESAASEELIDVLDDHRSQTKKHAGRIEQISRKYRISLDAAEKSESMDSLIREAEETIRQCETGAMRDAGIISSVQKMEHYEIAAYGTLRQFAITLNLHEAAVLLEQTLREEKTVDDDLTILAVYEVNVKADH